jgi:hypothetical protein
LAGYHEEVTAAARPADAHTDRSSRPDLATDALDVDRPVLPAGEIARARQGAIQKPRLVALSGAAVRTARGLAQLGVHERALHPGARGIEE